MVNKKIWRLILIFIFTPISTQAFTLYQEEQEAYLIMVNQALHQAVRTKNSKAIRAALHLGAQATAPSPENLTPLMIAAQHNDLETILILLEAGAPPDFLQQNGYTTHYFTTLYPTKKTAPLIRALGQYLPKN